MESLVAWFVDSLSGLFPKEVIPFIISMIPVLELRGGLVSAALLKVDYLNALLLCVIGNIIPIPFILFFIRPIFNWMRKTKLLRGFVEKLEKKSMEKGKKIEQYEFWGLVIFVGIPLPGTVPGQEH